MDKDVWEDNDDLHDLSLPSNDLKKLQETHMNEGYKVGIVAGQSKTTQEGFDRGYRKGAIYALQFGQTLGEMMGLSNIKLEKGLEVEVDKLIVEGNRRAQEAVNGDSDVTIDTWLERCAAITKQFQQRS